MRKGHRGLGHTSVHQYWYDFCNASECARGKDQHELPCIVVAHILGDTNKLLAVHSREGHDKRLVLASAETGAVSSVLSRTVSLCVALKSALADHTLNLNGPGSMRKIRECTTPSCTTNR